MAVLKVGVIMDPIEKIDINKDTTFVLMLEAQSRGHEVYYMELADLFIRTGVPAGRFRRVSVARSPPHYRFGEEDTQPLDWFNVVFMRKDPPFDLKFFFVTHLLSLVDKARCLVVNDPLGLREANEKLFALNFPQVIPETLVPRRTARVKGFRGGVGGGMIIKPLDGCGGSGVFYLHHED